MKDEKGLYYHPIVGNFDLRMYVRLTDKEVEFRPWHRNDPAMWDEHGWVPYSAVIEAAALHEREGREGRFPAHLYDIEVAIRLLKDAIQDEIANGP